jgi:multidrug efflux pump subunit AcrA (membrane-fusion protein)
MGFNMKRFTKIFIAISGILSLIAVYGCSAPASTSTEKQTAIVERGDVLVAVTADGNLSMPHEVQLMFGTPGTVKSILVSEGDYVRAGTLLAKMDDTEEQIAVTAAQYDVELALNQLAEKVYPSLLGYPHYYPSFTALLRVEQAQEELDNSIQYCQQENYSDAASEIRIMYYDLTASRDTLQTPITEMQAYPDISKKYLSNNLNPYGTDYQMLYPAIPLAIDTLALNLDTIADIQKNLENGNYEAVQKAQEQLKIDMETTHSQVNSACGSVVRTGISYPDASTSLSVITQVENTLIELQKLMTEGKLDTVEAAEKIRMALNDIKVSREILEDNELLLSNGLNLLALRQYNLNFQKAEKALQKTKDDLKQTEILAPFDGMVVSVDVKENEQLSVYDYASVVAVHLVDTHTVQLDGNVDEIDIFRVQRGQRAVITVDALPDEQLEGKVTFISPFSTEVAGIVNYPVTIAINPTDVQLKGGLTATANIIVDSRENVLYIPNSALKGTKDNYSVDVMVNKEKGTTEKRNVVIGIQNNNYAEVISGLKEGEEVVVERARPTKSLF